MRHNLAHVFFDIFASKAPSSKSLYSFWMRLKWLKITHFLFGKVQTATWKIKLEKSHQTSDISEITGEKIAGEKIAKLLGVFPEVVLCDIGMRHTQWFL